MKHDVKYFEGKLKLLEQQVTSKQRIEREELYEWAAECVSVFSYLDVPADIIRGFMNMFEHASDYANGPWREMIDHWNNPSRQKERISGFFYPKIAFTTAETLLNKIKEDERLVPQLLIDLLKSKSEYTHISSSLESMQIAFEGANTENLLAAGTSLLGALIDLHNDTNLKNLSSSLKKQLNFLTQQANKATLSDFGVDQELMELFHNFRYLRNKTSQHKKKGAIAPPLSVAFGFASLLLLLVYGMMAKNILITF